ncbi:MAG: hypothetical protein LUH82_01865 [Clostridiales bacterium]|nr:hypothetical protein [Clostridiales bacterium]
MADTTKEMGSALFEIYNGTSATLTYRETSYASGTFVPITGILKDGYTLQRAKLWGSDAGRSMTGVYSGTLLGIFPKITLKVGRTKLNATDIKTLSILTDQSTADCYFYDPRSKLMVKKAFYFDDVTPVVVSISNTIKYQALEIVAVATSKLSY